MNGDIKENVTRRDIWLRLVYMVIMSIAFSLAEFIMFTVVAFQFFSKLFTARTNDQLTGFGRNLARYLQQITVYLTFASEELPFPFATWPDEPGDTALAEADASEEEPPEEEPEEEEPAEEEPGEEKSLEISPETTAAVTEKDDTDGKRSAGATDTAVFADAGAYQNFMGEKSRRGGERFIDLLGLPPYLSWLDVGCGTGALSAVILEKCDPSALIGIDSSESQIAHAQRELGNAKASFRVANATALPFEVDSFDIAISSYVLNFVPDRQKMVDEMARVVRPEGTVAISVFDVAGGRQSTHYVWELIEKRDPAYHDAEFEKRGWNITHPDALSAFFENAGLEDVTVDSFEIEETFANFEDYWKSVTIMPTAGSTLFINSLNQNDLEQFKDDLKSLLPTEPDGSIKLISVSWVVRGKVPA